MACWHVTGRVACRHGPAPAPVAETLLLHCVVCIRTSRHAAAAAEQTLPAFPVYATTVAPNSAGAGQSWRCRQPHAAVGSGNWVPHAPRAQHIKGQEGQLQLPHVSLLSQYIGGNLCCCCAGLCGAHATALRCQLGFCRLHKRCAGVGGLQQAACTHAKPCTHVALVVAQSSCFGVPAVTQLA